MVSDVTRIVQRMQAKREAKRRASVRESLAEQYGEGTPEYYEAYNRYLYGEEQWEFIKSSSDGRSEEGYYVSGGGPAQAAEPAEETTSYQVDVSEAARSPTVSRIASPQETVSQNVLMSPTLFRESRDTIGVGPMGEAAPGRSTREEILSERDESFQRVPVELQESPIIATSRVVSPQETMSVESEIEFRREQEMGRQQLEAPREVSMQLSRTLVGDLGSYPKAETAPRAVAASVEWAVTLPAETLLSPVTATETLGQIRQEGPGKFLGEEIRAISRDPSGAGVKAGLTAGVILLPAARLVRGFRPRGSPGRTSYRLEAAPQEVPAETVGYLSDLTFKPEGRGIRGTGTIGTVSEGSESLVSVRSFTVPQEKGFKTVVEARRVARSNMDQITPETIRGTVISEDLGKGITRFRGASLGETPTGQLDLAGKPVPSEEFAMRAGAVSELGDVDVAIGRRVSVRSPGLMDVQDVTDVSGTKLLLEQRAGPEMRRVTLTREGQVPTGQFKSRYMDENLARLGFNQDTLRGFGLDLPPGSVPSGAGRQVLIAERAAQQTAQSFLKVKPPGAAARTRPELPAPRGSMEPEISTRPISGLGSLQRQRIPAEEQVYYRYPPSEGPELAGEATLNAPDTAIELRSIRAAGSRELGLVRERSPRAFSGRTRISQEALEIQGLESELARQQAQAQRLVLRLDARQAQRTRLREFVAMPGAAPVRERLGIISPGRVTRIPWAPAAIPPLIQAPGRGRPTEAAALSLPGLGYSYRPSLAGIESGVTLESQPGEAVTGLEIRPPPRRKQARGTFL